LANSTNTIRASPVATLAAENARKFRTPGGYVAFDTVLDYDKALWICRAAARAFADLNRGDTAPRFVAKTADGEKFTNEPPKSNAVLIEF
jgi:hypothetical protein